MQPPYTLNEATGVLTDGSGAIGSFASADPVYQAYQAWHELDPQAHQLTSIYEPQADAALVMTEMVALIQQRLDSFAQEHGYDSILSACTYIASQVPKFKADAERCVLARDLTWATAYEVLGAVQAGQRALPSWDELLAELPKLSWEA